MDARYLVGIKRQYRDSTRLFQNGKDVMLARDATGEQCSMLFKLLEVVNGGLWRLDYLGRRSSL